MHIDAGRVDVVRIKFAHLDVSSTSTMRPSTGRRHGIEVARGFPVDQVAQSIRFHAFTSAKSATMPCSSTHSRPLKNFFSAFCYDGAAAVVCRRLESSAASPHPARCLSCELQLQFAMQVLALELGVLTHVGTDHFLDLPILKQQARPKSSACIVGKTGQSRNALFTSAAMRCSGMPQSPNPPTAKLAPSKISLTASSAEATRLSIT